MEERLMYWWLYGSKFHPVSAGVMEQYSRISLILNWRKFLAEEEMEKSSRIPCILHMDSIRGSHKGLKNLIQSYLLKDWAEKHKEMGDDVARKFQVFRLSVLSFLKMGSQLKMLIGNGNISRD